MERADQAALAGAFVATPLAAPGTVELDEDAAHHLRVRRVVVGEQVRVTDGAGAVGVGELVRLGKRDAAVALTRVERREAPPPFHLLVPVGDRDRMLLLAEKAVELGVRSWQPVVWRRSLSVSPRGEGDSFRAKVRARMAAALLQCGGSWLPELRAERRLDDLLAAPPEGDRLLLDVGGAPLLDVARPAAPTWLAFGPEGGVEPAEREGLLVAGFRSARLAPQVLRFETAGIVALGVLHALAARAGVTGSSVS